jgi:acetyl-CoA carboxylase biotin carboxylase subunit
MFKKILVANRGEIAVRNIRACRDLNIESVAVYSEADRLAAHVQAADQAIAIGPSPSNQSYLVIEKIIQAALKSGAEAIHPGYGFLSENPAFAEAVGRAGLVFIGPPAQAMKMMGDKIAARNLLKDSGVPVLPGSQEIIAADDNPAEFAGSIGYPLLIKAAAGGGGKGMRIVHIADELKSTVRAARAEAKSAFGDDRIYIEKYLSERRHIEIQVLADQHGECIFLGERECSIQRRHQKVIEEAPSAAVNENLRRKMGETAVAVAKAGGYINAGTAEFLVDSSGKFYFLEMNTRLQMEHPVTEMVTGLDLVVEQIKIASGESLLLRQEDVKITGHAIECRLYAEDSVDFLPAMGEIIRYREPAGPGIRIDSGIYEGAEIVVYYDPLMAKLIAFGKDRLQAIARMKRALDEIIIAGVANNIGFHKKILSHPNFLSGDISKSFIEQYYHGPEEFSENESAAMAVAAVMKAHNHNNHQHQIRSPSEKKWLNDARKQSLGHWPAGNRG